MKYLFLDIDGVLNHEEWYRDRCRQRTYDEWWEACFDPLCVDRVNRILNETGTRLVVSSSWRSDPDLGRMFRTVGLPTDYDITPNLTHYKEDGSLYWPDRGEEIDDFLKNHACTHYVILDDDRDFTEDQKENHFVHCCSAFVQAYDEGHIGETGLTERKMNEAINKLNN